MDIRNQNNSTNTDRQRGDKPQFKTGQVSQASAKVMIPPAIALKLSQLSKTYGLPIDLSQVSLENCSPETIQATRKIVDMMVNNSKLLPELMKLSAQLLKADIKLCDFHKNLTKAAIKHQEKIDKSTAEIFLMMARGQAKSSKLEHRTNVRNQLIDKRTQAYEDYYQNSVFGQESKLIDAEYSLMASNQQILADSKIKRKESQNHRRQELQQKIDAAFMN